MPSQNLPKPQLPQVSSTDVFDQSASTAPPSEARLVPGGTRLVPGGTPPSEARPVPGGAPTPAPAAPPAPPTATTPPARPPQVRTPQTVPGGLSRENPGGTPPNMQAVAPEPKIVEPAASPLSEATPSKAQPVPGGAPPPAAATSVVSSRPSGPNVGVSAPTPPPAPAAAPAPAGSKPTQATTINATLKPGAAAAPAPAAVGTDSAPPSAARVVPGGTPPPAKKKLPLPLIIVGVVVALLIIVGTAFALLGGANTPTSTAPTDDERAPAATAPTVTLTYWGLWEDSQIIKDAIADFENKNPTIKIDYRKQSHRDYRERLQQAVQSGSGPDIFRYHVTWVPMLTKDLATMPAAVMTANEYKNTFYPTAFNNLQVGGQLVGVPLMYDGLALIYNKDMLRTANLEVPRTWAELRSAANALTTPANPAERQTSSLVRAGLAIGTAGNVDHFSDILGLLIVQNGGNPGQADSKHVSDALTFYTNFYRQDKVWSERFANSTVAFAQGDVAMILAPSWRIHDIQNINPNLEFGVAPIPQLDSDNPVAWATFWAEGVSSQSRNKDAAWAFIKHMSSPDVLRKFYNGASQYRSFGEIYPRVDMVSDLQSDELVGAFLADAPFAKTWYMASFTHDNGINDQVIKYYEDAVNAALSGGTNLDKALETLDAGLKTTLSKYSF